VTHLSITSSAQLADFCQRLSQAKRIGIDTEFVSEDTFRPELCLIQVVTDDELAVIDPYSAKNLSPFWQVLSEGSHVTIAHAAREELNFSLHSCRRPPAHLFDTQIAAGLTSSEYPSSYGSVVTRFLGRQASKGEQRTDWRRRPLSEAQIDYALEDVRYLLPLHDVLQRLLKKHNRLAWMAEEMDTWVREVSDARRQPRWRRVSGIGGLSPRSLSIVKELWLWRQQEAERRDLPPRRVLRDDLIVEVAKRKSDQPDRIRQIRGLQRGLKADVIDEVAACVRRGLAEPLEEDDRRRREPMPSQLNLLGQFLSPALTSICHRANVATSLAGTATDVRDLIAYRLEFGEIDAAAPPVLARGWRAELVGNLIDDLLSGRKSIRISDPLSEQPLEFDRVVAQALPDA
jgi:ribonuclease D